MLNGSVNSYRHLIQNALKHSSGLYSVDDVVRGVADGVLDFWAGERSCMVCHEAIFPQKKIYNIMLASGDLTELYTMIEAVEEHAKSLGCANLSLVGRKGWLRELKDWDFSHVSMVKKL